MTVVVPPRGTRWWFWAIGLRVDPLYRPWVAEQITRPDYARRRLWPTIAVQAVVFIIPQTLLALAADSTWRLVPPVALVVFYLFYVVLLSVRRRPMSASMRHRLLAYHGVAADGTVTVPVSVWGTNPIGRTGLGLLCAQVLVFSSGVAVAADRIAAQRACHVPPAADAAELAAVVGRPAPGPASAFGNPAPIVAEGSALVAAREVDGGLDGVHFVAAYARDSSGLLVGPGVWRFLDASTFLNPSSRPDVSAADELARQITPSTGYGISGHEDPVLETARHCARAAR